MGLINSCHLTKLFLCVYIAGRICNNFLVDCALFDKSMKLGTGVDL